MIESEAAAAEPNVELVYPVGVNHSKGTGTPLRARAHVPRAMAQLNLLSEVP